MGHASDLGRRDLWVLLAAAAFFFTANAGKLSLLPLDDCHYAQKGVEMAERGAFFTVTWGGDVNPQHAPLQLWILSRSFATVGFNDLAARLPSILMAMGILVCMADLGRRTIGMPAALTAMALLLATNTFLQNARRCMLEVPTAFWVSLFFVCYLRGLEDRRWHLALALPLAAAILTKSVVGLVPLAVVAVAWLRADLRPSRGWLALAAGIAVGLLAGSSWTLHQGLVHGWEGVREHYFKEVGRRSMESFSVLHFVLEYPRILLREFQPIVIPGLIGTILAWPRKRRELWPRALVLSLWILVWLAVANLSSARISRYVYPILVPLALMAGQVVFGWSAPVSRVLVRWVAPVALVAAGTVFWVAPQWLGRDLDAPFKSQGSALAQVLPPGSSIPLLGEPAWRLASPLLYYGKQKVGLASTDPDIVVHAARQLPRPLLFVETSRHDELSRRVPQSRTLLNLREWQLVELTEGR